MEEIFSKIIDFMEERILEKNLDLDKDNFVEIKERDSGKRIAFVDGGQAELLKTVNFSLQFIRTAALVFADNKKIKSLMNEFFVLIDTDKNDEYFTEIIPMKGNVIENIRINALDPCIREGYERASVSKLGGIVRRFAELALVKEVIGNLHKEDVVVLDGALKSMVRGEDEYLKQVFDEARSSGIIISSLAKTNNRIFEGECVASQIQESAPDNAWYYSLNEEYSYEVGIVKLHQNSNYVFEFNILKGYSDEVLSLVAACSKDVSFPGYPYGLIQVDRLARVNNQERDYLLMRVKAKAGKQWQLIQKRLNILNAHDILDNVS